jgi:hypothetical protein
VVLVVALVTAWVAGSEGGGGPGAGGGIAGSTDAVRLGPESGESVDGYLARVAAVRPGEGARRLALVAFGTSRDVGAAAATLAGVDARADQAVFRVPLPRVQTAVRRVPLDGRGGVDPVAALRLAEAQAANRAGETARTTDGRARAIAAAESPRLAAGCACVVALVVDIDPVAVPVLAARPGVRAVQVAPDGARADALAVVPLLPEQVGTVGPVPDDGPVPPP